MHAIRIDANVDLDHTVTIKLPKDVPVGPAEVILLYRETQEAPPSGNGPKILQAISQSQHSSVDFWKGASQEIANARDDWDAN